MTSDVVGVIPGTDEGAMMIRIPSPTIASATGTPMAAFAGRTFWARTTTAITDIHATLMTLSATSISISPTLEPTQQSPYSNPERTLSRQRRRKCCLTGVSSYTPAAITITPAAKVVCGRYSAYTAKPTTVQTARYDRTNSGTARTPPVSARLKTAGAAPGSIIAAIIDTQRAIKNANGPSGVATPMSIPFICRTEATQAAAESPSVAASAAVRAREAGNTETTLLFKSMLGSFTPLRIASDGRG